MVLRGAVRWGPYLGMRSLRRNVVYRQSVKGSFLRRNERKKTCAHLRDLAVEFFLYLKGVLNLVEEFIIL